MKDDAALARMLQVGSAALTRRTALISVRLKLASHASSDVLWKVPGGGPPALATRMSSPEVVDRHVHQRLRLTRLGDIGCRPSLGADRTTRGLNRLGVARADVDPRALGDQGFGAGAPPTPCLQRSPRAPAVQP